MARQTADHRNHKTALESENKSHPLPNVANAQINNLGELMTDTIVPSV